VVRRHGARFNEIGRQAVATALGREHRADPVLPGTGGPSGNARLTAWTGLLLLVLFIAELVTLLDVRGLISWHLALGVLLVPPALLKTATTGWRIVRYYTGNGPYRSAGPPPMMLRVLGPLVVLTTLALLGTGVALVVVGDVGSRRTLLTLLGQRADWLTLHQGAFVVWAVATGLHVLARTLPAWQLTRTSEPRVPGMGQRGLAVLASGMLGLACVALVLQHSGGWRDRANFRPDRGSHSAPATRSGQANGASLRRVPAPQRFSAPQSARSRAL
jgi:hypothetical protein